MAVFTDEHANLLDRLACKTLTETYAFAEITRDLDLFESVWTEDARFGSIQGRVNIREAAAGFMEGMQAIKELRVSPAGFYVQIDGDTAQGKWFIVSQLLIPQPDGTNQVLHFDAAYRGTFKRTKDGWRMHEVSGIRDRDHMHDTSIRVEVQYKDIEIPVD